MHFSFVGKVKDASEDQKAGSSKDKGKGDPSKYLNFTHERYPIINSDLSFVGTIICHY